jgi:hypothetical protein
MRQCILSILLLSRLGALYAQEASVEKSINNLQTGLLGLWINHETRIGKELTIRLETGFDVDFVLNGIYDTPGFVATHVITAEPRWYYQLDKRTRLQKSIAGNSGTFLSLKTSFHPGWIVITGKEDLDIRPQISAIPTIGIRRSKTNGFNYEFGFGLGVHHTFYPADVPGESTDPAVNVHVRVGLGL